MLNWKRRWKRSRFVMPVRTAYYLPILGRSSNGLRNASRLILTPWQMLTGDVPLDV